MCSLILSLSFMNRYQSALRMNMKRLFGRYRHPFTLHALFRTKIGVQQVPAMAVVVQRFLRAERSGVMFTRFARPDGKQSILVEHVEGDCEKLVKGEVTPERIWLNDDVPESLEGTLVPVHARALAQVARHL